MWQHKYYLALTLGTNLGVPILLGWLNGDIWGMLMIAGVLRLVLSHHTTFLINSAAHKWGSQPYTNKNSARDNGWLALFTFGEGYHNFHHLFEVDYRNGIRWWHFDPTKWLIRSLAFFGLASNLRAYSDEKIEKAKYKRQLTTLTTIVPTHQNNATLTSRIQAEYDRLIESLEDYYASKLKLRENMLANSKTQEYYAELKAHYRLMKDRFQQQKIDWRLLHKQALCG